ncbi:MAG: acyl-CoA dehydrogenase family protein, partial [Alphaproteobacteria bacterium]|nr:acyl-CoA dehydrogenase family protein [Alphaproteobacteria bacterium]
MDFTDTPEEAAFRAKARGFLSANAETKSSGNRNLATGWNKDEALAAARAWQARKAAGGFACITMPKEYGGPGLSPILQGIYNQEEANYVAPRGGYEIGLGTCIPTLPAHAPGQQKQRHAPPAARGEAIW